MKLREFLSETSELINFWEENETGLNKGILIEKLTEQNDFGPPHGNARLYFGGGRELQGSAGARWRAVRPTVSTFCVDRQWFSALRRVIETHSNEIW